MNSRAENLPDLVARLTEQSFKRSSAYKLAFTDFDFQLIDIISNIKLYFHFANLKFYFKNFSSKNKVVTPVSFLMKSRETKNSINDFKLIEEFEEIGALFNQGSITSLSRLQEHKPTNLSKALQMGFNTYTDKLRNPERFSYEEILKLAIAIGTDYRRILEVIQKEIKEKYKV